MKNGITSQKGLTLIEILVSIILLSLIVLSLSSLFLQSARTNAISKNKTEAIYIGQSELEKLIHPESDRTTFEELRTRMLTIGYRSDPSCSDCFGLNEDGEYIFVQITEESNTLGRILLKIFEDESKNYLRAQYEMLIPISSR